MLYNLLFIAIMAVSICLTESKQILPRTSRAFNKRQSNGKYSGKATWFIPSLEGGSLGACGPREEDHDLVVALNPSQYGDMHSKSQHCGKHVRISYKDVTVEALVNDACPECGYGDLDLTQPVFSKLGDLAVGIIPITWEFV